MASDRAQRPKKLVASPFYTRLLLEVFDFLGDSGRAQYFVASSIRRRSRHGELTLRPALSLDFLAFGNHFLERDPLFYHGVFLQVGRCKLPSMLGIESSDKLLVFLQRKVPGF